MVAFVAMLSYPGSELFTKAMLERMQYIPREELAPNILQWGADIKEVMKLMDLPCDYPVCGVEMTACDVL